MPFADLYEKINFRQFSLKTICAVNVVCRIIHSVGLKTEDTQDCDLTEYLEHLNMDASNRITMLNLPTRVKELLVGLIKPIYEELDTWHSKYPFDVSPTWSPHGIIDLLTSSRAVVNDPKLKKCYRFIVACTFCQKRQIFELARQLTDHEMTIIVGLPDPYMSHLGTSMVEVRHFPFYELLPGIQVKEIWLPIAKFWLRVFQGGGFHLTQEMCIEGLVIALNNKNEAAVLHFLGKVAPEGMLSVLNDPRNVESLLSWLYYSPATYCLMFSKISDQDLRRSSYDVFIRTLLGSLTRWPYQPLFLDVARSLWVYASETTFFGMLSLIIFKATEGYRDFDYRGLFIEFYEISVALYPEWSMVSLDGDNFALDALLTDDELWINFIFSKFSDREKELLLLDDNCIICTGLINRKRTHLLELFIRLCLATRIDLLLKVKHTFQLPRYAMQRESERVPALRLISQIVDKIVAEQEVSTGGTTPGPGVGKIMVER